MPPTKGLATRLIHTAEGAQPGAAPLSTPIYETTTFVFDSTADLEAYVAGGTRPLLLFAVRQPVAQRARGQAGRGRVSRGRDGLQLGHGCHREHAAQPAVGRRRGGLQRRDLRRHATHAAVLHGAVRRHHALCRSRTDARPHVRHRTEHPGRVVRVADQPDAALPGHRAGGRGVPDGRRVVGDRQHLRDALEPAAAGARCRPGDAQRDQVPQWTQRRHRGRHHGVAEPGGGSPAGTQADWRPSGPGGGLARGARPQDARRADGAAQHQRARARPRVRRRSPSQRRACTPGCPAIPITRSRRRRCAALAAW